METIRWNMKHKINNQSLAEAIELINKGEIIAFPTETVYGLGADATNDQAIKKIFHAKGRPSDNPLIVHVATIEQMKRYVKEMPVYVEELLQQFSPGPITYVLKNNGIISPSVTAGLDTIAIRIPNHPIAHELLRQSQIPIAAPSANLSGKPSPTTAEHVMDDMDGRIAGIIDGGSAHGGIESTVIDCTGKEPLILRLGGVSVKDMSKVVKVNSFIKESNNASQQTPKSPGLKYKHYAPEIPLIAVIGNKEKLQDIINSKNKRGLKVSLIWTGDSTDTFEKIDHKIFLGATTTEIARNLYSSFRMFKKGETDMVICFIHSKQDVGQAVVDRMLRAATLIED